MGCLLLEWCRSSPTPCLDYGLGGGERKGKEKVNGTNCSILVLPDSLIRIQPEGLFVHFIELQWIS